MPPLSRAWTRRWRRVRATLHSWGHRAVVRAVAARGSASIEFLGLGVLLLCPIAYGLVALVEVEQATLATQAAARNSARLLSADYDDPRTQRLAAEHIRTALANHGLSGDDAEVTIRCHPDPDCTRLGESLTVTVRVTPPVPLIGVVVGDWRMPIESSATFPRSARDQTGG